jgi:cAMP-specific phosphodiesterase 4
MLAHSHWYHSSSANTLRNFLAGKSFAILMVIALILALFLPDMMVITGASGNDVPDVILTIVMVLFTIELVLLSTVDATYFMSFFQVMDVVGTISMIFDVSYMQGTDATYAPVSSNESDAQKNLMLLRASRAAKIGARAGRLSRVLRILRFLPFLTGGSEDRTSSGIASMISGRLANLLATRVACLTIILVMVIPLFDIWTFPQSDYSPQTWVDRIGRNLEDNRPEDAVTELRLMDFFYETSVFGPWMACIGVPATNADGLPSFDCDEEKTKLISAWVPDRSGPPRAASQLRVHTDTFMVSYNMHSTIVLKSWMALLTIIFIIFIMIFSSLALSSVVTELAVRPLERMLGTVRQIAFTVFKFSAEVGETTDEDGAEDIDSSNEMKLLEKVVQKLAIVADLQTATNVVATEDMRDEDIGILSMMQGKNVVDEQKAIAQARKSCAVPRKKALIPTVRLEDFGVSQEVYQSWGFNALPLSKAQRQSLAVFTISRFHESGEGYSSSQDDVQRLQRFVQGVEKDYLPVPFHSFAHAVDVTHGVARLMHVINSESFLTDLEQYVLLIAAVAHDLGHPGVNNGFLSEVGHELALQYNDRSPLENMHCAKLYTIVANPLMNVFSKLSKEQYKEARKHCIEVILHTDMMGHGAMVKDLQMTYQMNQEVFGKSDGMVVGGQNVAELEVFTQAETKALVMECILHSADVSNPCRSWDTSYGWAVVCLEEFFAQGDQEKMLGIPVQFLNDRDKLNKPNSQIGFIEFMIAPFFAAQIRLWPALHELGENLGSNLAKWAEMWEQEVSPGEDEKAKVQGRVTKVRDNLQDAITRGGTMPAQKT